MRWPLSFSLIFLSFNAFALTDAEVLVMLKDAERAIQSQLPKVMGNSNLVSVIAGPGKRLTYISTTTLAKSKWTAEMYKVSSRIAYGTYCEDPNFDMMRDNDVTVSWQSFDLKGNFLYNHTLSRRDCKK